MRLPPEFDRVPDLSKLAAGLRSADAEPSDFHPVIHSVTVRLKPGVKLARGDLELIEAYARAAAVQADRIA